MATSDRLHASQLGEGPDKARFVGAMFSRIAKRYDVMNGLMTFGMHHAWRRVSARQNTIVRPQQSLRLTQGTKMSDVAAHAVLPRIDDRLRRRLRELGVAWIGGADTMTDQELNAAAATLHRWIDDRLDEGSPVYPPNVCATCLGLLSAHEVACPPRTRRATS